MANYLPLALEIVSVFGSVYFAAVVLLFLWLKKDKKLALNYVLALIAATAIVYGLKFILRVPRPGATAPVPFYETAFPSGHASRAFLYMTYLSQKFEKTFMYLSYVLAVLVGVSRVMSGEHTVVQVIAGSAIGIAVSWLFLKYQDKIFKKLGLSKIV